MSNTNSSSLSDIFNTVTPNMPTPDLSLPSMPTPSMPSMSTPSIPTDLLNTPSITNATIPDISVPDVSLPNTSAINVPTPDVSLPKLSSPGIPSAPSMPSTANLSTQPLPRRFLSEPPSMFKTVEENILTPVKETVEEVGSDVVSWDWFFIVKITIIVILLTIIGVNVFKYLARTTDFVGNISMKLFGTTFKEAGDVIKTTTQMSALGVGHAVDITGGAIKSAADVTSGVITSSLDELESALDLRASKANKIPESDNEESSIQGRQKSGYCYIGSERDYRTCMYVGRNDVCKSGEIYPTMDICVNPNLRV